MQTIRRKVICILRRSEMEELQLVMAGLKQLGGDAQTAFIVWALAKYGIPSLFGFSCLAYALKKGYTLIRYEQLKED